MAFSIIHLKYDPMKDCLQDKMYATSEFCTDSNVLRISAMLPPAPYVCMAISLLCDASSSKPIFWASDSHIPHVVESDPTDPACGYQSLTGEPGSTCHVIIVMSTA